MGRVKYTLPVVLSAVLAGTFGGMTVSAADSVWLEAVQTNLPEVTAYVMGDEADTLTADNVRGYLGTEEITTGDVKDFSEQEHPIQYFCMVDISKTIEYTFMQETKNALKAFMDQLGENESCQVITFGDSANIILNGSEDKETRDSIIDQIAATDNNTQLFKGFDVAIAESKKAEGRNVVLVFTDGMDDSPGMKTASEATTDLQKAGLPVYAFVFEKTTSSNKDAIDSMGQFARENHGKLVNTKNGQNVSEELSGIKEALKQAKVVTFQAENNIAPENGTVEVEFVEEGKKQSIRPDFSRYQKDETAPQILTAEQKQDNQITLTFSELVKGADQSNHYVLTKGDEELVPYNCSVRKDGSYVLSFGQGTLSSGTWEISCSDITDISRERNEVSNTVSIEVIGDQTAPEIVSVAQSGTNEITIDFSEPVIGANQVGVYSFVSDNGKTCSPSKVKTSSDNTSVVLSFDRLYEGNYTLETSEIIDASEEKNPLVPYTAVIAIEGAETGAPELVSVDREENNSLRVVFSESVTGADSKNAYELKRSDESSLYPTNIEITDGSEYVIVFKQDLPSEEYTLILEGIKDEAGNELGKKEHTVSLEADTKAPTLVSVEKVEENKVKLTFSEAVSGLNQVKAYTFTLDEKHAFSPVSVENVKKDSVVLCFDTIYNGSYTIECRDIKDLSTEKNPLAEITEVYELEGESYNAFLLFLKENTALVVCGVLGFLFLLLLIGILRFRKKLSRNVVVVNNELVDKDKIESKDHVSFGNSDSLPVSIRIGTKNGKSTRIERSISSSLFFGRSDQCDVYVDDPTVSKQHFVLEREGNALFITDLETVNGTFLEIASGNTTNRMKITGRTQLRSGQTVSAGKMQIRIDF